LQQAILYEKHDENIVKCLLCSHYCEIKPGQVGTCLLRKNIDGELFTYSYGASTGFAIDPIEKKPFYHFKPGSKVLSFGTPGCNFKCLNCQNWQMSHAKKDDILRQAHVLRQAQDDILRQAQDDNAIENLHIEYSPSFIADLAIEQGVDGIAYTYSEPTIFFEYARDTILECRKKYPNVDLFHLFISNGFMSKETIDLIAKENLISAINIDLKFMNDKKYRKICNSSLQPVLDNIKRFQDLSDSIHMEIINLVIPEENDSVDDINALVDFIVSVNPEIPLHFSRFHPSNKMTDKPATDLNTLLKAKEIAESKGLKYVYIGNTNLPGVENTYCPNCKKLLIERSRYSTKVKKSLGKILRQAHVLRQAQDDIVNGRRIMDNGQFTDSREPKTDNGKQGFKAQLSAKNGICLNCEHNINIRL